MPFDGTKLNQIAADLLLAKEVLQTQGWVPRCGDQFGHCAITALGEAVRLSGPHTNLQYINRTDASSEALQAALGVHDVADVASWNDAQKSVTPILELYDKAIASCL